MSTVGDPCDRKSFGVESEPSFHSVHVMSSLADRRAERRLLRARPTAFAERRLEEILTEIRGAAGRSSTGEEFDEEREGKGALEPDRG